VSADPTPSAGEEIADTLDQLSSQTRRLVQTEVRAARDELLDRLRQAAPAAALATVAAGCGVLAVASSYRLSMRVLEAMTSPGTAAVLALAGYGTAGIAAGQAARRRFAELGPLFPRDLVRQNAAVVSRAAGEAAAAAG